MHVWMGWSYRMGRRMAAPRFEAEETREERAENDHPLDLVRVGEEVGVRADVQAVLVAVGLVLAAAAKGAGGSSSRDARGTEMERRRGEDDVRGAATRTETRADEAETRATRATRPAARDGVAVVARTMARVGAVISMVSLADVRRGLCAREGVAEAMMMCDSWHRG